MLIRIDPSEDDPQVGQGHKESKESTVHQAGRGTIYMVQVLNRSTGAWIQRKALINDSMEDSFISTTIAADLELPFSPLHDASSNVHHTPLGTMIPTHDVYVEIRPLTGFMSGRTSEEFITRMLVVDQATASEVGIVLGRRVIETHLDREPIRDHTVDQKYRKKAYENSDSDSDAISCPPSPVSPVTRVCESTVTWKERSPEVRRHSDPKHKSKITLEEHDYDSDDYKQRLPHCEPNQEAQRTVDEAKVVEAALEWPMEEVLSWLQDNGFNSYWQDTFKDLEISGQRFAELGRGTPTGGGLGGMHQYVYPKLAQKMGADWDQLTVREEGKRLRRLIRRAKPPVVEQPAGEGDGGWI